MSSVWALNVNTSFVLWMKLKIRCHNTRISAVFSLDCFTKQRDNFDTESILILTTSWCLFSWDTKNVATSLENVARISELDSWTFRFRCEVRNCVKKITVILKQYQRKWPKVLIRLYIDFCREYMMTTTVDFSTQWWHSMNLAKKYSLVLGASSVSFDLTWQTTEGAFAVIHHH